MARATPSCSGTRPRETSAGRDPAAVSAYLDATSAGEEAGAPLLPELRRLFQAHPEPALDIYLQAVGEVVADRRAGRPRCAWALRRLEEAAELIAATPSLAHRFQADSLRLRALLHIRLGACTEALIEMESAMQAAMRHHDRAAAARVLEDLSEAAATGGAPGPAACCNRHALGIFEIAGDQAGVDRCRRRAERLQPEDVLTPVRSAPQPAGPRARPAPPR